MSAQHTDEIGFLCRQIRFAVVPLVLAEEEAKVMIEELNSDWLKCAVC
jgi:hypothetical protein